MHDFLSFFIIQILLLAVVLSVHTYLGLHIIRRGLIFSDLALDQLAALGVIVGIGIGFEGGGTGSYFISFIAVFVGAVLLAVIKPKNPQLPREAVIGIIYCLALVASFMVADKISGGISYVTQTLAGCLLWVTWPLVWATVVSYILLAIFHYKYRDKIIGITDNKNVEHENFWDFLFFLTQGIITVLIVPIAGVLLAYSFLMIPAAIGVLFTRGWSQGLIIGWTTGFVASIIGLLFSYFFSLPYGPSLVLSLGVFFFGALILRILIPDRG
ncbi:hypothetical protein ES703_113697 [subsurface metagenome]